MSADCPGCWPTPKLPITRVKAWHSADCTYGNHSDCEMTDCRCEHHAD